MSLINRGNQLEFDTCKYEEYEESESDSSFDFFLGLMWACSLGITFYVVVYLFFAFS